MFKKIACALGRKRYKPTKGVGGRTDQIPLSNSSLFLLFRYFIPYMHILLNKRTHVICCIFVWIFSVCAPPPQYVMLLQLQSTCHYLVNDYVKIWHVCLGCANNMHPLSWEGGGGTNGKDPNEKELMLSDLKKSTAGAILYRNFFS